MDHWSRDYWSRDHCIKIQLQGVTLSGKVFHVEHSDSPTTSMTYRIEGGTLSRLTGQRLPFALRVFRTEGPGLLDWSSVHFSTAKSRSTLLRRVKKLYPEARCDSVRG